MATTRASPHFASPARAGIPTRCSLARTEEPLLSRRPPTTSRRTRNLIAPCAPFWHDGRLQPKGGGHWQERHQRLEGADEGRRIVRCGRRKPRQAPERRQAFLAGNLRSHVSAPEPLAGFETTRTRERSRAKPRSLWSHTQQEGAAASHLGSGSDCPLRLVLLPPPPSLTSRFASQVREQRCDGQPHRYGRRLGHAAEDPVLRGRRL